MKIRYDKSVNAAYISLKDENENYVFGFTYCCDPKEVNGQINLKFDIQGRLIGIEVLQASVLLPRSLLEAAESRSGSR